MKIDKYEVWEPINDIPKDLYFHKLEYDGENINVFLREFNNESRALVVRFGSVLGYRVVNESSRSRTLYDTPTFEGFKTSKESEFLRWLLEESTGILDEIELTHYLICNVDNVIDVITGSKVSCEWMVP